MSKIYTECNLCHRRCSVNRTLGEVGICGQSDRMKIARADLHFYEEPIISGSRGSGAIFFSGCSLGCIFCQNADISHAGFGEEITEARLCEIMLSLQSRGAHNINFVTPTHFAPSVASAVTRAKEGGLKIPTVYNTSAYDTESTLSMLDGKIDIYLPDLKYHRRTLASRYSSAPDLPERARAAIDIMVEQRGEVALDDDGMLKSGVVVRVLLLPSCVADAKLDLKYLHTRYGNKIYISIMSQYTPRAGLAPPLNRRVTAGEYDELCDYARAIGIERAFVQQRESASDIYTPSFDLTGVRN